MYKTIEPPVGRLHRLYWTLAATRGGRSDDFQTDKPELT
ncbi:MAG: hypothetical protein UZ09_BCD002001109 [Bacteroidetes bacterium OLB9]|nr:MAG: hypothetical protein UZ09_BCD002001109 [Bacteroidetes bacterium OLB9]